MVAEYEAAPHGEKAAVLRREGLYQSQVREWRAERDARAAGVVPQRHSHRTSKASVGWAWADPIVGFAASCRIGRR